MQAARQRLLGVKPQWAVAWRAVTAQSGPSEDHQVIDLSGFHVLPDDGQRYYADPFIVRHGGATHVFVEEFPYDSARGIISVFEIDAELKASAPRPILSVPHHLSYPQVFTHEGEIWMLPEGAAGGGLDLYRCLSFPDQWKLEARLIDQPLHDATLHVTPTGLKLFASGGTRRNAEWDSLLIFSAPALLGPWTAASNNPVLVDARAARPAGPLLEHNGRQWRPAQDCSRAYGGALSWAEITPSASGIYTQRRAGTVAFAKSTGLLGPHTWMQASGLEVIDVFATPADIASASRRRG